MWIIAVIPFRIHNCVLPAVLQGEADFGKPAGRPARAPAAFHRGYNSTDWGFVVPPPPLTQPSLRGEQSSPPDLPLAVGSKHRLTTCCGVKFAINHLDFKIGVKVAVSNIIKTVK